MINSGTLMYQNSEMHACEKKKFLLKILIT